MGAAAAVVRIAYLTRSLEVGGAEVQLVQTAAAMQGLGHDTQVLSFYDRGPLKEELQTAGIDPVFLGKRSRWDIASSFARALRRLRIDPPDILHSFLTPANIFSTALVPFLHRTRFVWGVRSSYMDWNAFDTTWRISYKLEGLLSRFPQAIVTNSKAGLARIKDDGFSIRNAVSVPNGIDTRRFSPRTNRDALRREIGIQPTDAAVGIVARLDPMKGHDVFLRAAARLRQQRKNTKFVIVGGDGLVPRGRLQALQRDLGLEDSVAWLGHRKDMASVYSALDVHTSSSYGEGFSNSVAEGMACAVPTVATDVGDSRDIVANCGRIVPPGDSSALAAAWDELLSLDIGQRQTLGDNARRRIEANFSVDTMISRLLAVYDSVSPAPGI